MSASELTTWHALPAGATPVTETLIYSLLLSQFLNYSANRTTEIVRYAVPRFRHRGKIDPATKTFQALRIAVNDELGSLERMLHDGFAALASEGRMAIITFHSLEDRIVKRFFKACLHDQLGILPFRKPLTPTEEEIANNPRSRSAKLRVMEKI